MVGFRKIIFLKNVLSSHYYYLKVTLNNVFYYSKQIENRVILIVLNTYISVRNSIRNVKSKEQKVHGTKVQ